MQSISLKTLKNLSLPAYRLDFDEAGEGAGHVGGLPSFLKDKAWPTCSACGNFQLFVIELKQSSLVFQLFICESCLPWSQAHYQEGKVTLLSLPDDLHQSDEECRQTPFPTLKRAPFSLKEFQSYPDVLDGDCLGDVSQEVKKKWEREIVLVDQYKGQELHDLLSASGLIEPPRHQTQGYPHWIQDAHCPHCSKCHQKMDLLLRLGSEPSIDQRWMWGDMGVLFVHQCAMHRDEFHFEMQSG